MTTTDTPRTDAEWASTWQTERRLHELCQQLERELLTARDDNFNLANALSLAHEELCQAGLREYGN